jgi:pyruvate dehydrogenase E1 component alpha subunit
MGSSSPNLSSLWRTMVLIRRFEQAVSEAYAAGKIPGFIHLSIGQEAIAAAACGALRQDDYIYVSHRGHGQSLAKGAEPRLMMAELFGKETGYCRGRGGSMHIAAFDTGVLGANAIVAGSFPLAIGAAYAIQTQGGDQVVVLFFGDGAVNEGTFHESLNLAALWKLPVIFVCENNGYAQFTPIELEHANTNISQHAAAYGMEGMRVDGNNVATVYQTVQAAVKRARDGEGPSLIEALTYRWHGHYEGDPERYRDGEEVEEWKAQDPIAILQQRLLDEGTMSEKDIANWEAEVESQLASAVKFAEESPAPEPGGALQDVYV